MIEEKEAIEMVDAILLATKQYVGGKVAGLASAERLAETMAELKSLRSLVEKQSQSLSSLRKHCESLERKIGGLLAKEE